MTGPEGNSEFCFPRISMFPETKSRETLKFEENKIHCSPRDQSLSDLLYSKANGSNRWKTNNHAISQVWYNGSYIMAAKPIKTLELHYTMM